MQLHLILPAETPDMPFTELRELAVLAERLGYRGAWLPDHLLPPGRYEPGSYGGVFDPLVALAAIAGATSEIRLGTSVLVLPLRSPFVVAKQAATIERISAGRFTLGVGIGWDAAEFSTVGAEFTGRAARADEAIELIRQLLGGDGAFTGRHCGSPGGVFEPVPTGPVPIAVGGSGKPALRRAARLGDEWQPIRPCPERFAADLAWLRANSARPVRASVRTSWTGGAAELDQVLAEVSGYERAGAAATAIWFGSDAGVPERMAEFIPAANEVLRNSAGRWPRT
ncbi:TIGR03619 family F420-dependent LLM class oxidoreductase [Saccharopolyspora sp. HNM0986]|uniref:TIGR03619 family F420-dependent LLM class oxidoreductase n=1 Tax=Saccharopolyspora galaxeae TaxID=2781241 RepID=UPI00190AE3C6|nr:TIGR03619 family F420-dependent LLM class oxidoreductase [Saccharopolyspora sp. HNM0986]MBK0869288.1 TIGR03619 family F420-dependent LLM class oxidoreductase [Saccharopolyspora sp. HNM0986]